MVQPQNTSRRNLARSLRNGGYSYAEIQKFVRVPKATLSYWFKDIKLSEAQLKRLEEKRKEAIQRGGKERLERVARKIEEIQTQSSNEIGEISKRELWLIGVILYWRNQNKADVRRGVQFTSSDAAAIKLFLKWLKEIGQLNDAEISFDLFVREKTDAQAIEYWSNELGYTKESFSHIYRYKKKASLKVEHGLLRIRVQASSMLARQLAGWIQGIQSKIK
jgi:DNA-binding transcriptional MerR regulator